MRHALSLLLAAAAPAAVSGRVSYQQLIPNGASFPLETAAWPFLLPTRK